MKLSLLTFSLLVCTQLSHSLLAQNFDEINLTNTQGDDRHPFFSPDDSKIIFESNRDGNWEIYLMNSDGSNQQNLTNNKFDDRMPSFHPSGNAILFFSQIVPDHFNCTL